MIKMYPQDMYWCNYSKVWVWVQTHFKGLTSWIFFQECESINSQFLEAVYKFQRSFKFKWHQWWWILIISTCLRDKNNWTKALPLLLKASLVVTLDTSGIGTMILRSKVFTLGALSNQISAQMKCLNSWDN